MTFGSNALRRRLAVAIGAIALVALNARCSASEDPPSCLSMEQQQACVALDEFVCQPAGAAGSIDITVSETGSGGEGPGLSTCPTPLEARECLGRRFLTDEPVVQDGDRCCYVENRDAPCPGK